MSRFALLHASGVYVDAIRRGIKAFCLETELFFPLVENEEERFKTAEELDNKLLKWELYSHEEKSRYMEKTVEYYLSPHDSIQRHKEFVERLLNE